jgi:hypothetical protein
MNINGVRPGDGLPFLKISDGAARSGGPNQTSRILAAVGRSEDMRAADAKEFSLAGKEDEEPLHTFCSPDLQNGHSTRWAHE